MTVTQDVLKAAQRSRFRWGENDCLTFVADVLVAHGAEDAAKPWRGTYNTGQQAADIIADNGGIVAVFDAAMDAVGARRIEAPESGAVAVIKPTNNSQDPFGAMWTGSMWAAVAPRGLAMFSPDLAEVISSCRKH